MYAYMHIGDSSIGYINMHMYMYAYECICMHEYMHTYKYAYIHAYTHTYRKRGVPKLRWLDCIENEKTALRDYF